MLKIGNLELKNPVLLAPLAGYTDLAFRMLAVECECALVCTEMVSSHGLVLEGRESLRDARTVEEERPVAVQLFGADLAMMVRAATLVESRGTVDIIDINMGCPVSKVVRACAGAGLMKSPGLVGEIVSAVTSATSLPVTVKIRSGWDNSSINAVQVAQIAACNGAAAVTVHPRTRKSFFTGSIDRDVVKQVVEAVNVPVFFSGDIQSLQDAITAIDYTGCSGVMVGRGALGRPWLITEIAARLSSERRHLSAATDTQVQKSHQAKPVDVPSGTGSAEDNKNRAVKFLKRHVELAVKYFGPRDAVFSLIPHLSNYIKGVPGARHLRRRISEIRSMEALNDFINELHNELS